MKIFVISLKRSQDRRQTIKKNMAQYGIDFDYIDALDGRAMTPEDRAQLVHPKLMQNLSGMLTNAEVCCAASHAMAYQTIVENNIEHAIIMEDDAVIPDKTFKDILDNKSIEKTGVDMMLLFHDYTYVYPWQKPAPFVDGLHLYKPVCPPTGAVAYYLSLAGAKKLYNATRKIKNFADFPYPIHTMNTVAVYPCFIHHVGYDAMGTLTNMSPDDMEKREQQSTINEGRNRFENLTNWKNVWFRIPRILVRYFYIPGIWHGCRKILAPLFLKRIR